MLWFGRWSALACVLVHTGATESDHFLHGVDALGQLLDAQGRTIDYKSVTDVSRSYLSKLALAFDGIYMCLTENEEVFVPPAISQSGRATICGA
jgi:hypothetical protein